MPDFLHTDKVAWLLDHMKVRRDLIIGDLAFRDRLRVQKAAFLLKHLGVSPFTDYSFNMYVSGPYSPPLARDYYGLGETVPAAPKVNRQALTTLDWFLSHDNRWLEVASSIMSVKENNPKLAPKATFEVLVLSKPWVKPEYFDGIHAELVEKALIK